MYKKQKIHFLISGAKIVPQGIIRIKDEATIPFDPDNTDYANFKKEVLEGAELQDADGVVMSADAAKEFVRNLP